MCFASLSLFFGVVYFFNSAFYVSMCGGVIVSSASDFVVVWFIMRGVKKSASLYTVYTVEPIAQNENLFSTWFFFLVSTEFHLDAAGFYLQLSERAVSVASKDSAFRECLARRQTVESFSLDEIENRGKKAHDTHSSHARNKNGSFLQ